MLELGTANVELAPFDFMRSPAGIFLLAWQSLQFGRDPLEAAIPILFMLAALFGMIAAEAVREAFSVSKRAAFAIAALGMCAPVFRWSLATFSLAELLTATALLAGVGALVRAASRKQPAGLLPSLAAIGALLWFAAPGSAWRPAAIATGFTEIWSMFSPAALVGLPQSTPVGARTQRNFGRGDGAGDGCCAAAVGRGFVRVSPFWRGRTGCVIRDRPPTGAFAGGLCDSGDRYRQRCDPCGARAGNLSPLRRVAATRRGEPHAVSRDYPQGNG